MNPNHKAGHIPKPQYLASVLALLAISLIIACVRFYIRMRVQRQRLGLDDFFLLFGLVCLIVAVGILFHFIESMYLVTAIAFGGPNVYLPPDFAAQVTHFRKWCLVSLELLWFAGCAVKFSFLALFYNLIQRQPRMKRYWYLTTAVSVITYIFGITAYILPCPWMDFKRTINCLAGSGFNRTFIDAAVQLATDIFSDVMNLLIPIRIIWKVRIRRRQKLALSCSLCLTIIMIVVTVMRLVGLRRGRVLDVLWEIYWQFVAAEVGLILTAAAALRTLFVVRAPSPLVAAAAAANVNNHRRFNNDDNLNKNNVDGNAKGKTDIGVHQDLGKCGFIVLFFAQSADYVRGAASYTRRLVRHAWTATLSWRQPGRGGSRSSNFASDGDYGSQAPMATAELKNADGPGQGSGSRGGSGGDKCAHGRSEKRKKTRRGNLALGYRLPQNVPRATMTGIRTFIHGGRRHSTGSDCSSGGTVFLEQAPTNTAGAGSGSGNDGGRKDGERDHSPAHHAQSIVQSTTVKTTSEPYDNERAGGWLDA